jgi:Tfp pilus assembly protein PilX
MSHALSSQNLFPLKRPMGSRRRGVVGVLVVMAMLMGSLLVASMLVVQASERDVSIHRLESARALYAAEAGINMALREVYFNADHDGDGVAGTISNDGNDANDPAFNAARVIVTRVVVGPQTTYTSTGRSGDARRSAQATVE